MVQLKASLPPSYASAQGFLFLAAILKSALLSMICQSPTALSSSFLLAVWRGAVGLCYAAQQEVEHYIY
jgi:hypothetical protein